MNTKNIVIREVPTVGHLRTLLAAYEDDSTPVVFSDDYGLVPLKAGTLQTTEDVLCLEIVTEEVVQPKVWQR